MKITIEKSPNQERDFYHVVYIRISEKRRSSHSKPVRKSLKKLTNAPADEVTTNLKTENGTDFHETNGKHTKNHENGIENNHQENDQKSNDQDEDQEESIDLTDKVRKYIFMLHKLCTSEYYMNHYFLHNIIDKMRRNEIIKSISEVSNFCSRSS